MKSLSRARLFATPWTTDYQAPPSMRFSRQEYWSRLPFPSQIFPTKGFKPGLPHCRQMLYHLSHQGRKTPTILPAKCSILFLVPRSKFSELVFDIISPVSLLFIFLRILILLHLPLQLNVLIQLTSDLHFAKSNSSFSYYLSITAAFDTLLFSNHPKLEILDSAFVWVLLPYGHLVILTTYMKQPSPLHITHTHTHTHTHRGTWIHNACIHRLIKEDPIFFILLVFFPMAYVTIWQTMHLLIYIS